MHEDFFPGPLHDPHVSVRKGSSALAASPKGISELGAIPAGVSSNSAHLRPNQTAWPPPNALAEDLVDLAHALPTYGEALLIIDVRDEFPTGTE